MQITEQNVIRELISEQTQKREILNAGICHFGDYPGFVCLACDVLTS